MCSQEMPPIWDPVAGESKAGLYAVLSMDKVHGWRALAPTATMLKVSFP